MATLQTHLKMGGTRLLGTSALAIAAALAASPAFADCSPAATTGDDVVVCDNSPAPGGGDFDGDLGDDDITITGGDHGNIFGNFGTDTITITGGTVALIQGDYAFGIAMSLSPVGNDTFNLNGGTVTGDVMGLQLNDTFNLNGTTVLGSLYGGITPAYGGLSTFYLANYNNGANTFNLNSGSVAGGVFGENRADTFTLNGATIPGTIYGEGGNDTFILTSGSVNWLQGGEGADTFTLDGATVTLAIDGGAGNDTINLVSGSADSVLGGDGEDTITLNGATVTGFVHGGTGNDLMTINSGTYGTIYGGGDSDTITINGGTVSSIQGDSVTGGGLLISPVGQDVINLFGGTVQGDVLGLQLGDTITLDGAGVLGNIYGGIDAVGAAMFFGDYDNSGGNTFVLTSGFVGGGVFGENGVDTFTLNGATVVGSLGGGNGNDTFTLTSGSAGSVDGGGGTDAITLNGATVIGAINGGGDADTIDLLDGTAASVQGGEGADTVTLNGATITGMINGGDDADTIDLLDGSAAQVQGGAGDDAITLNGATIAGEINGGGDADTIDLLMGSAASVQGGTGADAITLNGAIIAGAIDGGDDADMIDLLAGSAASVQGWTGADTITLNGATIAGALSGGDGADTISLVDGSAASVQGGTGSDAITLNGAIIAGALSGNDGADTILLGSGSAASVDGGTGEDTITLNGGTVSGVVTGGSEEDIIIINGGSYGTIYGAGDTDRITINGGTVAAIQGDLTVGGFLSSSFGEDVINLSGGTVTGDVMGLQGLDFITLNGTTVMGNIYGGIDPVALAFFGGVYANSSGNVFTLTSGSVGGDVVGEDGADRFTLNGATITGALDGGAGNDRFTLSSGSAGSLQGGTGSDTATLNGFNLANIAGAFDGGDDTSIGDGLIDTLTFNTSGTIGGAQLLNWEIINLGAGQSLQLTGAGLTTSSDMGYGFAIAGGSALSFGSDFTLTGNLTNAGALVLSGPVPAAGDVVTVTGDFGGAGALVLDADLDALTGDRLVVNGVISGNHAITINNLTPASAGGPTGSGVGAGLVLVDNSAGPGVTAGQFGLSGGPITAGFYRYDLSAESDGILYLQSVLLGEAAAYGILGEVMRDAFPTLHERLGQRTYALDGSGVGRDVWASVSSDRRKVRPDETNPLNGGDWNETRREVTIGVDVARFALGGGEVVGSLGLHVISGDATTFGTELSTGDGSVSAEGLGLGGALTWFGHNDVYVDVQGRLTKWDLTAGSADASGTTDGKSWGLSVEAGQRLALGQGGALTPRVQLVWSEGKFDGFTDDMGMAVDAGRTKSLILSSGLTYERQLAGGAVVFADLAVYRDFFDDSGLTSEGSTILSGASESWGKLSLGASLPVSDSGRAYFAARGSKSLDAGAGDDLSVGFEAGLRLQF